MARLKDSAVTSFYCAIKDVYSLMHEGQSQMSWDCCNWDGITQKFSFSEKPEWEKNIMDALQSNWLLTVDCLHVELFIFGIMVVNKDKLIPLTHHIIRLNRCKHKRPHTLSENANPCFVLILLRLRVNF